MTETAKCKGTDCKVQVLWNIKVEIVSVLIGSWIKTGQFSICINYTLLKYVPLKCNIFLQCLSPSLADYELLTMNVISNIISNLIFSV